MQENRPITGTILNIDNQPLRNKNQSQLTRNPKTEKSFYKEPPSRMKKAFKLVHEENKPVSVALQEAGYSKHTASKPKNITETKAWAQLVAKYTPEEMVLQKHRNLLNSKNENIVAKGVDLYYKVTHKYSNEEKKPVSITNILNVLQN